MHSLGDAFGWPARGQGWFGTVLLQGLITLIPIVGSIATLGWMLMIIDNLRAGRQELPRAGFHLERGLQLFGVLLVYSLGLNVLLWVVFGLASVTSGRGSSSFLVLVGVLLAIGGGLLFVFGYPAIIVATNRGGFGEGMNLKGILGAMAANPANTLLAGLVVIAAGVIGGLGLVLCFFGVIFTATYAQAVIAAAAFWFEQPQPAQPSGAHPA